MNIKKRSRMLVCLMVLAMICTMLPTAALATEGEETIYTVTTDSAISGGSLTVNPASGTKGDVITVTVTPDEGKQLIAGSLKYTADGGSSYTDITATEGVYSFALPEADVLVTAGFEDVPAAGESTSYAVIFSVTGEHGSIAAAVDSAAIGSGDTVEAGKTVVFTASADEGYQVKEWTMDGQVVADNKTNTLTVENLAADQTVSVEFEAVAEPGSGNSLSLSAATCNPSGSVALSLSFTASVPIMGAQVKLQYDASKITLDSVDPGAYYFLDSGSEPGNAYFCIVHDEGILTTFEAGTYSATLHFTAASDASGEYPLTFIDLNSGSGTALFDESFNILEMTTTNGSITVSSGGGTEPATYSVTVDSAITGGSIAVNPASGTEGSIVNVAVTPDSGKRLMTNSLKYTADGGSTYTTITNSETGYSFFLPAAHVVVTAQFEDITGTNLNSVYLSSSGEDVYSGDSSSKPVKTFAKAKELLANGGTIYIVCDNTFVVSQDQTWDLADKGDAKVKIIRTGSETRAYAIQVSKPATLTLSNIDITYDVASGDAAHSSAIMSNAGGSIVLGNNTKVDGGNVKKAAVRINADASATISGNVQITGNFQLLGTLNLTENLTHDLNVILKSAYVSGSVSADVAIGTAAAGVTSVNNMKYVSSKDGETRYFKLDGNSIMVTATEPTGSDPAYYITASAGDGGSISPSGKISVIEGDEQAFTITSDEYYIIKDVKVDGVSVINDLVDGEGNAKTYTFTNVTASHTIEATFELLYKIEITLPDNAESLDFGSVVSTIADYYTVPEAQTVTVTNTGNETITLNQPADSSHFGVGTLSKTVLAVGETATFTVRPKEKLALGTYSETITISTAIGDTVLVNTTFTVKPTMFTVTTMGIGGTVTLNGDSGDKPGAFCVQEGTSPVFTITPYPGCSISDVLVDGTSVISDNTDYIFDNKTGIATYTFPAVSADHTILAIFDSGTPAGSLAVVYLNGMMESSGDGATAETAVKTFAEAKALLAKDGVIYITGEVTISGTEYWTLQNYGNAMIKRGGGYTGHMILNTSNSSLILENIIIDGGYQQDSPDSITAAGSILYFNAISGSLAMEDGTVLQNNYVSIAPNYYYGGAVSVSNSTFTMNGGVIRNNYTTCFGGGGVAIGSSASAGTFIMNGGEITGNTATAYYGGGVYVGGGTFTMNGGSICHNGAIKSAYGLGGGVYTAGTFTMNGGTVGVNNATNGGGIYAANILMNGGTVSENNATNGGGVYATNIFTMNGGEITDNAATASGGGVYVDRVYYSGRYNDCTFTAIGGTVLGNTAGANGNGAYIQGAKVTISPAPSNVLNLADGLYLEADAYLNLGRTIAALPGLLKIKMAVPDANSVVAQGSDYTVTAEDAARFLYETYDWEFALNGNQIVLAQPPASDVISVTPENLTFDMVSQGYGAGEVTAKTVTVTNISQATVTLNQVEVSSDSFIASGLSKTTLEAGEPATFTVSPRTGLPGGYYSGSFLITTTDSVKAVVKATFTVGYSITIIPPAEGGTITVTPDKTLFAPGEESPQIGFLPEPGYRMVEAVINGIVESTNPSGATIWFYNDFKESKTASAVFELATYNIDASVYNSEGGAIAPSGVTAATGLQDKTFTFTPDQGWHIKAVYVDNIAVNPSAYADNTYTFETVTANHSIVVSFAPNEYSVVFHKNADDATGSMEEQSFTYGDEGILTKNTFSRSGYTFTGWATTAEGIKTYDDQANIQSLIAENNGTVILYAVWTSNKSVYAITPVEDAVYSIGSTNDGIKTMTVNTDSSGLKYFTVNISSVIPHSGDETAVFVHQRNGVQLEMNASRADFDQVKAATAGFNVLVGDVVKVYLVDELSNAVDFNPVVLQ